MLLDGASGAWPRRMSKGGHVGDRLIPGGKVIRAECLEFGNLARWVLFGFLLKPSKGLPYFETDLLGPSKAGEGGLSTWMIQELTSPSKATEGTWTSTHWMIDPRRHNIHFV